MFCEGNQIGKGLFMNQDIIFPSACFPELFKTPETYITSIQISTIPLVFIEYLLCAVHQTIHNNKGSHVVLQNYYKIHQ